MHVAHVRPIIFSLFLSLSRKSGGNSDVIRVYGDCGHSKQQQQHVVCMHLRTRKQKFKSEKKPDEKALPCVILLLFSRRKKKRFWFILLGKFFFLFSVVAIFGLTTAWCIFGPILALQISLYSSGKCFIT